ERTMTLIIGALAAHVENAIAIIAVFSTLAVIHRVAFLWRWVEPPAGMTAEEIDGLRYLREEEVSRRFFPRWLNFVFCNYPRMSLGYDVLSALIFLFLLAPVF
ncbi:MAG: hypothetical protein ACRD1Z_09205, partial [Vicinamibacteria bacterium]